MFRERMSKRRFGDPKIAPICSRSGEPRVEPLKHTLLLILRIFFLSRSNIRFQTVKLRKSTSIYRSGSILLDVFPTPIEIDACKKVQRNDFAFVADESLVASRIGIGPETNDAF